MGAVKQIVEKARDLLSNLESEISLYENKFTNDKQKIIGFEWEKVKTYWLNNLITSFLDFSLSF